VRFQYAGRAWDRALAASELRALCSVPATGVDAPKTDLVFTARQVQSPVRYMQMVGRGLRGEKNGGTRECRIVTVEENLGEFGHKMPYDFCKRYFRCELAASA
jgi:superfamily II DNA or RNA helicase